MSDYDIIIVGAGIVGATAALALAKNTTLRIAVLDAGTLPDKWDEANPIRRVSAITLASQRIFQRLGVWPAIQAKRISPYQKMRVWDANSSGAIEFDSAKLSAPCLGYIIEDTVIRLSVLEALRRENNVTLLASVDCLAFANHKISTAQHGDLSAKLFIAADGANSWLRTAAGIALQSKPYHQQAIVATVTTELPHAQTARQRFLASGPLAFLPLVNVQQCSIVWSVTPALATDLMACDSETFKIRLSRALEYELGAVTSISERHAFTLQMRHAQHYVQDGLALIGDAAHTVHPLAGQGVNLGLLDAVALAEVITTAWEKRRQFASRATLRRYERWRKGDTVAMLAFVSVIKDLFAIEMPVIKQLREAGLNLSNQTDFIKNFFVNYAVGNRSDLPELARV